MECTRCHKILDIDQFSYKNVKQKIYYLYCNNCREKVKQKSDKKNLEKEQYAFVKATNVIECACGKKFISFREYHTMRHNKSKKHRSYMHEL